jgi:2'-5' RNA ligase
MIRSFIAIELPQETREALAFVQEQLKQSNARVRWVNPSSIHLTLKFLGNITSNQVDDIAAAALRVVRNEPSFSLYAAGLGVFPNQKRPRVIWADMQGDVNRLCQIQTRLEHSLVPLGFACEERPFRPHLTLGRIKDTRRCQALISGMTTLPLPAFNSFDVNEIILYKSDLRPTGAIYTKLHRMPLSASHHPNPHQTGSGSTFGSGAVE